MKLFFILIVIPIIASTDHYLELHNSQSKSLDNLTSNDNYYFNIQLENRKFPKVKIEFIMNSTCSKPFNEVNFYEYPSYTHSKNYRYSKSDTTGVIYNSYGKKISAKLDIVAEQVFNFETQYVAFAINPSCEINSMDTTINVYGDSKTFLNGETQNITNLNAMGKYYFSMKATKYTRIKVSLIVYYTSNDPLPKLDVIEYSTSNINSVNGDYRTVEDLKTEKISTNLYLKTLEYTVKKTFTNLIAFSPNLITGIDYLLARFDFDGGYYNLTNGNSQSLNRVIAGYEYYFFIQVERYSTANITLTMVKMNSKPFCFILCFKNFSF